MKPIKFCKDSLIKPHTHTVSCCELCFSLWGNVVWIRLTSHYWGTDMCATADRLHSINAHLYSRWTVHVQMNCCTSLSCRLPWINPLPLVLQQYVAHHHILPPERGQWQPELTGCGTAHSWRKALQIPTETPALQTDGLWVCHVADALPVHIAAEGLPQLPLQETDQRPVGPRRPWFSSAAQHLALWSVQWELRDRV